MQTYVNFLITGKMRYIIIIFLVFATSCVREDESTVCYSYTNATLNKINMEFYSSNGTLLEEIEKNGIGLITKKCYSEMGFVTPRNVVEFDSVIVKFNDARKLTFSTSSGANQQIFLLDFYQREGETLNFNYIFTEEDFNNAEPF